MYLLKEKLQHFCFIAIIYNRSHHQWILAIIVYYSHFESLMQIRKSKILSGTKQLTILRKPHLENRVHDVKVKDSFRIKNLFFKHSGSLYFGLSRQHFLGISTSISTILLDYSRPLLHKNTALINMVPFFFLFTVVL